VSALSDSLARTFAEVHGEAGRRFAAEFEALRDECRDRWSLALGEPFAAPSYHWVAPAMRRDGTGAVLKLGPPCRELECEAAALARFEGRGAARLLAAEPARGALLLERLLPGEALLREPDDARATQAFADLTRALHRPAPEEHAFPTTAEWGKGFRRLRARFGGDTGPFPAATLERAERLFAELLASSAAPVLLHGDLHHENILSSERAPWLAIDPKGVVGEPAYEVGAWLRNPRDLLEGPDARRTLARRVDQLAAELALARSRVTGWGFAQSVLSAWWSYEDHGAGFERDLALAEILHELRAGW
jgi:streptomycin 6-kinase